MRQRETEREKTHKEKQKDRQTYNQTKQPGRQTYRRIAIQTGKQAGSLFS